MAKRERRDKNLPCSADGKCIGARCSHFVDLGLEGTDCDLQFSHEGMDVVAGIAGLETVLL